MTITKIEQNKRREEALQFLQSSSFDSGNIKNVLIQHFSWEKDGKKIIPYIPIRITTLVDGSIVPYNCKSNLTQEQMEQLKLNKKLDKMFTNKNGNSYEINPEIENPEDLKNNKITK